MIFKSDNLQAMLMRYLRTQGPDAGDILIALAAGIESAVWKRISRYSLPPEEAEDLGQDCIMSLLARVNELKDSGSCSIANFDGYVMRTVDNRVIVVRGNPERRRIGTAIERLLAGKMNVSGLAVWQDQQTGDKVGGFDEWSSRSPRAVNETLENPRSSSAFANRWLKGMIPQDVDLADLVCALLDWHGAPIRVNDLVGLVCTLRKVERPTVLSLDAEMDSGSYVDTIEDSTVDVESSVVDRLEHEGIVARIWDQLSKLKGYQITAVCLKLEPDEFVALLVVAGRGAVADALGIDAPRLEAYVSETPMRDDVIAGIVGLEPKQIPSVRKKALQRITRHLRKDFPSGVWQYSGSADVLDM